MTTQEATKILFNNGIKVLKQSKNCYSVSYVNGQPWENRYFSHKGRLLNAPENHWTGREIVKLARDHSQTSINKNVKKFNNDKDRRATRDAIQTENFDVIPPKKETKREDRWGWS